MTTEANRFHTEKYDPSLLMIRNGPKNESFRIGAFLGKGGFARCFEVINDKTKEIAACKIVAKKSLTKRYNRDKMLQEIKIHKRLNHPYIVRFFASFEDYDNVYILLELCERRSLKEVLRRRKRLTYQETRYFMHQMLEGVSYLHDLRIIHRDLKLGNLFLTKDIQLRIGDFGVSTELDSDSDIRRTHCGTPNYMAPEILENDGHSFGVDIWSCGCILYTLLVGKPPFESVNKDKIYERIKEVDYRPDNRRLVQQSSSMVELMLQKSPGNRPMARCLLQHLFFTESPLPTALPESILTTKPRIELTSFAGNSDFDMRSPKRSVEKPLVHCKDREAALKHIASIESQLEALLDSNFTETELLSMDRDDAADPASKPVYWVSKWVDYTDRYGLGYQLCDNSLALLFNDNSRMVLFGSDQLHYIDHLNNESYHTTACIPSALSKKFVVLNLFRKFMHRNLLAAGGDAVVPLAQNVARLPYLRDWFSTQRAFILFLSNGTLQLNFSKDHTKIILCPLMGAVSYIDKNQIFRTYSLKTLKKRCPAELADRLKYAHSICGRLRERLLEP